MAQAAAQPDTTAAMVSGGSTPLSITRPGKTHQPPLMRPHRGCLALWWEPAEVLPVGTPGSAFREGAGSNPAGGLIEDDGALQGGAPSYARGKGIPQVDAIAQLHQSLDARLNPETVAGLVLDVIGGQLQPAQRRLLEQAAQSRPAWYSSSSDDFDRPVPAEHKVRVLLDLLDRDVSEPVIETLAGDPWQLMGQLRMVGPFVGWHPGSDFKSRLNRQQRAEYRVESPDGSGPMSRRQYNRLVRHLQRTQDRAKRLQKQVLLRQLVMVGRSGLAYSITLDDMLSDPTAACFVAYWVAQRNRRREFSIDGRVNPFDTIASMLFDRCVEAPGTDWWMIARAYPTPQAITRLNDLRVGELMGRWFGFMHLGAEMLAELYAGWPDREIAPIVPDSAWADRPGLMPSREARGARVEKVVDLRTMIVRKGVDSSAWNTVAQAYNACRAGWLNCLAAGEALPLADEVCPGKAMRLMAADLAAMHYNRGGLADPETRVWADLPFPWHVLSRKARCTVDDVEYACRAQGVDPHAKGWTAPRQTGPVGAWRPTPELVHGVEVADPLWAGLLRRAGVFSGKKTAHLDLQQDGAEVVS